MKTIFFSKGSCVDFYCLQLIFGAKFKQLLTLLFMWFTGACNYFKLNIVLNIDATMIFIDTISCFPKTYNYKISDGVAWF